MHIADTVVMVDTADMTRAITLRLLLEVYITMGNHLEAGVAGGRSKRRLICICRYHHMYIITFLS